MGYTTEFEGQFDLNKELFPEHKNYLNAFSETRRMSRNKLIVETLNDPIREAVSLPVGEEGAYFVGGKGFAGQDHDNSILDYNQPPNGQPGLWCKWIPNDDGTAIVWNGAEKFYNYVAWLEYIIEHFLAPWGYSLTGKVRWRGEEMNDIGTIEVVNNVVAVSYPDW